MNLIDRVAELQKLEGRQQAIRNRQTIDPNHAILERIEIERKLLDAVPELLSILGEIRPGDDKLLALMILNNQQRWTDENWQKAIDCLRRYQAMAERMEAKE